MSKKRALLYRRYYSPRRPGEVAETRSFIPPTPEKSFRDVVRYLIGRKYIHVTQNGYCHLLPKGVFIHEALVAYADQQLEQAGALRYRFSSFFSTDRTDAVWPLISRFEKQMYKMVGSEEVYLKYASDPVLFEYLAGRQIETPLKIYSPDYFFRAIQTGELRPLINPREFYMTDYHFFCEPHDFGVFVDAALMNKRTVEALAGSWYLNVDTNAEFFEARRSVIVELLDRLGVNAVVNVTGTPDVPPG